MSGSGLGSILMRFLPKLIKPATSILKNVAAPLGLSVAMSGIDGAIQRKIHGYGSKSGTTGKFSNEEINDMVNIVKTLEDSDILMKGSTKTFKNDVRELHSKKGGALPLIPMILGTLGASILSGRGMYRAGRGNNKCNCGKGVKDYLERDKEFKKSLILPKPHPLTNFEIIDYFKNEPRFNCVYSRDNLPKIIKNGAYVINLDEHTDIGTRWISLYLKINEVTYFDSFGVEYIPKEIEKFIGNKDIKSNIFRIQAYNSIICGYFCILFVELMFKGKTLGDFI